MRVGERFQVGQSPGSPRWWASLASNLTSNLSFCFEILASKDRDLLPRKKKANKYVLLLLCVKTHVPARGWPRTRPWVCVCVCVCVLMVLL
jgi:hypothetical protein